MKLWGVEGGRHDNGTWEWKTRHWTALVYDISDAEKECDPSWVWALHVGMTVTSVGGFAYPTAERARNALIRAVKRLGIRIPRGGRGRT